MVGTAILAAAVLLAIFSFLAVRGLLQFIFASSLKKSRLFIFHQPVKKTRPGRFWPALDKWNRRISETLESAQFKIQPRTFHLLTIILVFTGTALGALLFASVKGVILSLLMLGSLPYLLLSMRLVSVRMKARVHFLPAVEVYYQYYVMAEGRNIRKALKDVLREQRILYTIRPLFEQLHRNLSTQRDIDESFRIFAASLGHQWGMYFSNILRVGLEEGVNVSEALKELILDMRKSQRADQVERNRLLEIRIANFTPVVFLGAFLAINFYSHTDAYYYYLVDPAGRGLLLDAVFLIFLSFLMGLYLSMRKM